VILAVVPANVDFHNSQILHDAKKVDPKSARTIPVITKPDLIDKGAEKGVLELLRGDEMDFELGFHMIKCPGQQDRNEHVTVEAASAAEMSFFRANEPWRTECEAERERFGTLELRKKLAALQVRMIKDNVPSILEEVAGKKRAAEDILLKTGYSVETDGERRAFYGNAIESIVKKLDVSLTGNARTACSGQDTFLSKQQAMYDEFGKNVLQRKFATIMSIETGSKVACMFEDGSEETGIVVRVSADGSKIECKPEFAKDDEQSKLFSSRRESWSFRHPPKTGDLVGPLSGAPAVKLGTAAAASPFGFGAPAVGFGARAAFPSHGFGMVSTASSAVGAAFGSAASSSGSGLFGTSTAGPMIFGATASTPTFLAPAPDFGASSAGLGATDRYGVAREVGEKNGDTSKYPVNVDVFRQLAREDVRLHADWLKELLKRNRDNSLQCFLSPAVFNSIVAGMIKDQIAPLCTALLEQTRTAVSSLIGDIVKESRWRTIDFQG
jgi:hypothetical protein